MNSSYLHILSDCEDPAGARRPRDVPWKSLKSTNVRDLQGNFRGLLGEHTRIDDLMKKRVFLDAIVLVLHICYSFWKNKYSKVLNGDVHGTSKGPSSRKTRGPNDGKQLISLWLVSHNFIVKCSGKKFSEQYSD